MEIPDGWTEEGECKALTRTFTFKDFAEAFAFGVAPTGAASAGVATRVAAAASAARRTNLVIMVSPLVPMTWRLAERFAAHPWGLH